MRSVSWQSCRQNDVCSALFAYTALTSTLAPAQARKSLVRLTSLRFTSPLLTQLLIALQGGPSAHRSPRHLGMFLAHLPVLICHLFLACCACFFLARLLLWSTLMPVPRSSRRTLLLPGACGCRHFACCVQTCPSDRVLSCALSAPLFLTMPGRRTALSLFQADRLGACLWFHFARLSAQYLPLLGCVLVGRYGLPATT